MEGSNVTTTVGWGGEGKEREGTREGRGEGGHAGAGEIKHEISPAYWSVEDLSDLGNPLLCCAGCPLSISAAGTSEVAGAHLSPTGDRRGALSRLTQEPPR